MNSFTQLFLQLEASNKTTDKVEALANYFRSEPHDSAAWGLFFLLGNRMKRVVNTRIQREWVAEFTNTPLWLLEECYSTVGDSSETISLLLPRREAGTNQPLAAVVSTTLTRFPEADEQERRQIFHDVWNSFSTDQIFLWQKLQSGGFRTGVAKTLVIRALAKAAGIDPPEMALRVSGKWEPTAEVFASFLTGKDLNSAAAKPYPFCLAYALEQNVETLGPVHDWQVEWKWDGIRAQLICRGGQVIIWSRGEELITEQFPEIEEAGKTLPAGCVLDGELIVWKNENPLSFAALQKRLGRKNVSAKLLKENPVAFIAYDLLEQNGMDLRSQTLAQRRENLVQLLSPVPKEIPLRCSTLIQKSTWQELTQLRTESRERFVEGFMLKRKNSAYGVGRTKGDWWKWKVEPYTCDCVMIYAQSGSGKRASLYTDYTFAVWQGDQLVPVMKAYSGLTDQEIARVDKWIRKNTLERFGPVRVVNQELVFELAFEGIQRSPRHKSGIAVRFPRIKRWREDKSAAEADHLETLEKLLPEASK